MIGKAIHNRIGAAATAVRQAFRGVINTVKSDTPTQFVQLSALSEETINDSELVQHFGFTSAPPAGTQAVVIPLGGRTSHAVVIATEHGEYRIKSLPSGATAVYDQSGTRIVLNNDGTIDVHADKTTYHGNIVVNGTVTSTGDQIAGGISQITHTHGGIKSGGSNTAPPN